MVECLEGHPNPTGFEFCGDCGAPLDVEEKPDADAWHRAEWAFVGALILAVIVLVGVAVVVAVTKFNGPPESSTSTSERSAIQEWWLGASEPVEELQDALADTQLAVQQMNDKALESACQQMHDLAAVDLRAHLPSPDPDVTSELQAAIEDAHEASHMCLAAAAGTVNSYVGEFASDVDQARKHLDAAEDLTDKASRRSA